MEVLQNSRCSTRSFPRIIRGVYDSSASQRDTAIGFHCEYRLQHIPRDAGPRWSLHHRSGPSIRRPRPFRRWRIGNPCIHHPAYTGFDQTCMFDGHRNSDTLGAVGERCHGYYGDADVRFTYLCSGSSCGRGEGAKRFWWRGGAACIGWTGFTP